MKTVIKIFLIIALLFSVSLLFLGADGKETVYVTNSGGKYHRENCSSLSRSKIAISLDDAVRSDYEPCSICKPPTLTGVTSRSNNINNSSQASALYRVNTAGLAATASADINQMVRAEVVGHVDGDTVRVRIENPPAGLKAVETIRLLGVDTPETVHPTRQVERFGKEASDYTKSRLLNQKVFLAFDWDLRDRYGRLLAYIYDEKGCFNAELVRQGYGFAYTRYAFQFADEFRALERQARQDKRGLWGE